MTLVDHVSRNQHCKERQARIHQVLLENSKDAHVVWFIEHFVVIGKSKHIQGVEGARFIF